MANTETIAIIRKIESGWIAAVAFIDAGESTLDVATADSEATARRWVADTAANRGIAEAQLRFLPKVSG